MICSVQKSILNQSDFLIPSVQELTLNPVPFLDLICIGSDSKFEKSSWNILYRNRFWIQSCSLIWFLQEPILSPIWFSDLQKLIRNTVIWFLQEPILFFNLITWSSRSKNRFLIWSGFLIRSVPECFQFTRESVLSLYCIAYVFALHLSMPLVASVMALSGFPTHSGNPGHL